MDPIQALNTIDVALASLPVNRETHAQLILCVKALREVIIPHPVVPAAEPGL